MRVPGTDPYPVLLQFNDKFRNKKKQVRKLNVVRVGGGSAFCFDFQVKSKMAKQPVVMPCRKQVQFPEGIAGRSGKAVQGSCSQQTFEPVMREVILVIIEQATYVKTVAPVK